jgi:hypothetical protein
MSKRNRDILLRTYGQLYSRLENCSLDDCWYCNDVRQELDHCPPLKHVDGLNIDKFVKGGGKLCLIPCCRECNSILGDKPLFNPEERLAYLYDKYLGKVDKFFSDWSEDEIEELGPTLKRSVLAKQKLVNGWIEKSRNIETNILRLGDDCH